jgi:hypothetical protein
LYLLEYNKYDLNKTKMKTKQVKKRTTSHTPDHSRYLYQKLEWLYLHSARARARFMYEVFAAHDVAAFYGKTTSFQKYAVATYQKHFMVRLACALSLLSLASVVLQLSYPSNRTLPFSRLEGNGFVGIKSEPEIAGKLDGLDNQRITIKTKDKSVETTFSEAGVSLDKQSTFKHLSNYSKTARLIPFSIVASGNSTQSIVRSVDSKKLDSFVSTLVVSEHKDPQNAVIKIKDTKLIVEPSTDGYQYHNSDIKAQLLGTKFAQKEPILINPEILAPQISTSAAGARAESMQRRIDTPLTIFAADKSVIANSQMIISWIDIKDQPDQGTINLSFNKARIAVSLSAFASILEVAPKPAVSTLLNGSLAGSVDGSSGRTLRFSELVDQVAASTDATVTTIAAQIEPILPKQQVVRRYSRDSQGIQSLLDQWGAEHGGHYSVYMRTQNGNIQAGINPYQQLPSGNMSRLYVAHLIYGRLAAGSLSPTTPTNAGVDVDGCLEQMLVYANDNCLYALGDIVGWGGNNGMLVNQGLVSTLLSRSGSTTSPADLGEWFMKVQGASLVTPDQSAVLINKLSRYTKRSGIPAGSLGIQVADTTDSARSNRQEAALVFHPRSNYVLAIMSSSGDGNSAAFAELASEINRVLNE